MASGYAMRRHAPKTFNLLIGATGVLAFGEQRDITGRASLDAYLLSNSEENAKGAYILWQ
jgi:hypothetical protein